MLTSGRTQDKRVEKDCFIFTSCLLHSSCKYVSHTDKVVRKLTNNFAILLHKRQAE